MSLAMLRCSRIDINIAISIKRNVGKFSTGTSSVFNIIGNAQAPVFSPSLRTLTTFLKILMTDQLKCVFKVTLKVTAIISRSQGGFIRHIARTDEVLAP